MTYPKLLGIISIILFSLIAFLAYSKSGKSNAPSKPIKISQVNQGTPIVVELEHDVKVISQAQPVFAAPAPKAIVLEKASIKDLQESQNIEKVVIQEKLPEANRVQELFNKGDPKLPIVETITYKSRVPWQKGRPAWLSDYASYYSTSRHFIARSLNGKPDYFKQDVAEGDRFNVLRKDKNINFHLLIDVSRCKLWLYYVDLDKNERVLLKNYTVGLGRIDTSKTSGLLSPLGKYSLGNKIAIYKPKMLGYHNGQKVEMIRIFGSR